MATVKKRPPGGRIIKQPVKGSRKRLGASQYTLLPAIQVNGKRFSTTRTYNTSSPPPPSMSHDSFRSHQKVRAAKQQSTGDYLLTYCPGGEHAPIHTAGTPQLSDTTHHTPSLEPPVPYRFSFRKSEEGLVEAPPPESITWQSAGIVFDDRESMFSRERSYVLSTPFHGTRPQNDLDKEKLSELQIIVGDNTLPDKPMKRRLLRKPLPFSHYKKSQKVRIIHPIEYGYESSQDSLKVTLLGQQASDAGKHNDANGEEDIKKQSKKLVTSWLKEIDRKIDTAEGNSLEAKYSSNDESDLDVGVDTDDVAKSLQEKQSKRVHRSRKSGRLLPIIYSMSPGSKMSPQHLDYHHRQHHAEVGEQDEMEDYQEETSLNLPALAPRATKDAVTAAHIGDPELASETVPPPGDTLPESYQQEYDSEHLPSILYPTSPYETEELERERLKLIHLEKHKIDTSNHHPYNIQSEPCYPSFAMNTFYSKGTSSRSITNKPMSLRDMASAFKSRMGYPVASPTHCGDRMWKDRITNYSSTVIHNESYDNFARQKFPKPTKPPSNVGNPDSSGSETRQRMASFTNAHGTFRKPQYEGHNNTSARSLSEDSGRGKVNNNRSSAAGGSDDQLTKIKLKTREYSNASLHSLNSSMKSDRNSGVFRGRKLSNPSLDPDTTRSRKLYRSDSNLSLSSVKGGSKKGSSKHKRRNSKPRFIGIGVNE